MVNLEVPHFSTAAPLSATRRTFQPPFTAGWADPILRAAQFTGCGVVATHAGHEFLVEFAYKPNGER